jgi:hypothetical protein
MIKQTSKQQILLDIEVERRRLEKNLSELTPSQMTLPGVVGAWTIKDVLAHLIAWERFFVGWYEEGLRGGKPKTPQNFDDIHALNKEIYERNKNTSLDEVIKDFHTSYQRTLAIIQSIPEEDIFDHFPWTGRWMLGDFITANTCNHYYWAKTQIRNWLKSTDALKERINGC